MSRACFDMPGGKLLMPSPNLEQHEIELDRHARASRSKNGVAKFSIGPATSGRTRWLAYRGHPRLTIWLETKT